jgi:hypothetical protein
MLPYRRIHLTLSDRFAVGTPNALRYRSIFGKPAAHTPYKRINLYGVVLVRLSRRNQGWGDEGFDQRGGD